MKGFHPKHLPCRVGRRSGTVRAGIPREAVGRLRDGFFVVRARLFPASLTGVVASRRWCQPHSTPERNEPGLSGRGCLGAQAPEKCLPISARHRAWSAPHAWMNRFATTAHTGRGPTETSRLPKRRGNMGLCKVGPAEERAAPELRPTKALARSPQPCAVLRKRTMLVLSRKPGETVALDNVTVTASGVHGSSIRQGFQAPPNVNILRGELAARRVVRPTSTRPKPARTERRIRPAHRDGSARVKN